MNDPAPKAIRSNQSTRGQSRARVWLGIGLPAAILAASYIPFLLLRSELPDRVASHFDSAGRADDSMTIGAFLVVTGVMVVIGLGLSIGLAWRRSPVPAGLGATVGFLGPFIATLGGGILATTAVSQRGIDRWMDAPNAWWSLLVVLIGAIAAGAAGAWLGSQLNIAAADTSTRNAPVMDLGDGEQAVWTTSLHSAPLFVLGLSVAAVGVVLVASAPLWLGIVLLVSSVPLMAVATVHVRVDRSGLQVRYGRLPWPKTLVAIDRIDTASMIDVRPKEWGGWGYRGSLKLMRQAAVVHRAGPGIRLDLKGDKVFVVTVDSPETGVALLNAQVQRGVTAE